jgi:hypothetical protein
MLVLMLILVFGIESLVHQVSIAIAIAIASPSLLTLSKDVSHVSHVLWSVDAIRE